MTSWKRHFAACSVYCKGTGAGGWALLWSCARRRRAVDCRTRTALDGHLGDWDTVTVDCWSRDLCLAAVAGEFVDTVAAGTVDCSWGIESTRDWDSMPGIWVSRD